jgi:hypothetical protein
VLCKELLGIETVIYLKSSTKPVVTNVIGESEEKYVEHETWRMERYTIIIWPFGHLIIRRRRL